VGALACLELGLERAAPGGEKKRGKRKGNTGKIAKRKTEAFTTFKFGNLRIAYLQMVFAWFSLFEIFVHNDFANNEIDIYRMM